MAQATQGSTHASYHKEDYAKITKMKIFKLDSITTLKLVIMSILVLLKSQ